MPRDDRFNIQASLQVAPERIRAWIMTFRRCSRALIAHTPDNASPPRPAFNGPDGSTIVDADLTVAPEWNQLMGNRGGGCRQPPSRNWGGKGLAGGRGCRYLRPGHFILGPKEVRSVAAPRKRGRGVNRPDPLPASTRCTPSITGAFLHFKQD